jgi:tetratricopeptide (TPR) repeat protein
MTFLKCLWPGRVSAPPCVSVCRGEACLGGGAYGAAIAAFTAAIRLDPANAAAFRDQGLAYEEQGEYEWAIADYTQAIRPEPQCADVYFGRGNA